MAEEREYKGYWWLPSNPNDKIAGVLHYTPEDGAKLEIFGSFKNAELNDNQAIILGHTSTAKDITLFNCFGSFSITSRAFPVSKYSCHYFLEGRHLNSWDVKCFDWAVVEFDTLNIWCCPTALTFYFQDKGFNLGYSHDREVINETVIEDAKIALRDVVSFSSDHLEPKVKQCTQLKIERDGSDLDDFLRIIHIYRQFVSLATLIPCESAEITLYSNDDYQDLGEGNKNYRESVLYCKEFDSVKNEKAFVKAVSNSLFHYTDISDRYSEILKKWFVDTKVLGPIREHLIDSITHKPYFSSVDFLIVVQALEGFWWRLRDSNYKSSNNISPKKRTSLETIIEQLKNEFGDISKTQINTINVAQVVDSRHYLSHFVDKSTKPNAVDGIELLLLSRKLRQLLVCCLLSTVGFSNNEINKMILESHNTIFRED